ncbi:aromatic acid exporter family protein [Alkalihalobacillus sp. R86527]|uniref:aromatic acid exporter family protein n=1 Tax=Alkalihalobacillus sp. R86527 TaxID=3093863 RepID=UPI0036727BE1
MKLKIGYRTLKTAIGTGVAITIAQLFSLDNYVSAGILTILCIKPTTKRSFHSSWQRFLACLLGIVFSAAFFEGIGYTPLSISLLLLLFIPVVVGIKATEGVITSSVIILHIYNFGTVSWSIVFNEVAIIVIGIGVALLFNLYMPNLEKDLLKYRVQIEEKFSVILMEYAVYLQQGESSWDGKEMLEVGDALQQAKSIALKDIENHMLRDDDKYYKYFKMREKQFFILERLLPIISSLDQTYIQGQKMAEFMERLSDAVKPQNTAGVFLDELYEMREEFRNSPLPSDRSEFETRSALHHFLNEIEQYLLLKRYLKPGAFSESE